MPVNARANEPSMEEILASIRRIISDEVAAEPAPTPLSETPARPVSSSLSRDSAGREPLNSRAGGSGREASAVPPMRSSAAAPLRPAASAGASGPFSFAPPASSSARPEGPVDYAPRGRAPATDPFAPRPLSLSSSAPAYTGAAARALEPSVSVRPAIEPRRVEPRLFPDSRPLPEPRPLSETRPRVETRASEPRPLLEPRPATRPLAPLESDLDKPLAAALLDLALVEQAVQAELANVVIGSPEEKPAEAAAPAAMVAATAETTAARETAMAPVEVVSKTSTASVAAPAPVVAPVRETEAGDATSNASAPQPAKVEAAVAEPAADAGAVPVEVASVASDTEAAPTVEVERPAPAAAVSAAPNSEDSAVPVSTPPRPESRAAEPRPLEARTAETRSAEARLNEARQTEARLSDSRLVAGSRFAASAEANEPARERLVSAPASTAVSAAFGSLHRSVSSNARTVDDLVTEALRPMLKAWLDENLPALVERLVRAEIERVARHGQ